MAGVSHNEVGFAVLGAMAAPLRQPAYLREHDEVIAETPLEDLKQAPLCITLDGIA